MNGKREGIFPLLLFGILPHCNQVFYPLESLLPYPFHFHDIFDPLELTMFLSEVHDSLGHLGSDPRKLLELRCRSRVDVDLLTGVFRSRLCIKREKTAKQKANHHTQNQNFDS